MYYLAPIISKSNTTIYITKISLLDKWPNPTSRLLSPNFYPQLEADFSN